MRWRAAAKKVFERALAQSALPRAARKRRAADVLILAYHNVIPSGERSAGERSLHVSLADFEDQLDVVAETHAIVPLVSALARPESPPSRPRAVVTFDDAYRGAVTVGLHAAVARGLSTTVFIAPRFVGGQSFWWDALADPATGQLDPALRRGALWDNDGDDTRIRAWAVANGRRLTAVPEHATCAHAHELTHAAALSGVTFGSHSWSHANLASLGDRSLTAQLRDSAQWLAAQHPSRAIPCISYPYGLSSASVERLAAAEGFLGGLRIDGGWHRPGHDQPYALPRLNVPSGLSRDGFLLRASGIFAR